MPAPPTAAVFDAHAVLAALQNDNLDGAIESGLMQAPALEVLLAAGLLPSQAEMIEHAASQRRIAWAARARFEARNARVAARKRAREEAHRRKADEAGTLPPAANAALLRALSRVRTPKA